jgi:protein-tyrosine phosphatase
MIRPRILELPGSCNLRDFGGYATVDGRRVREGRLLRSGVLHRLTPGAVEALRAMDIRAICDLRRTEERRLHPNPCLGTACRTFEWDTAVESSPMRERGFIESPSLEDARRAMVGMYERLPYLLQPRLAGVFEALAHAGDGATLVHCSAGKDRTGVAVALVLETLGVPRETIVVDYVYTNQAADLAAQLLGDGSHGAGLAATAAPLLALPQVARTAVLEAHPSYIAATFTAIETRHGGVERYLREELQLDTALLDELRGRLLA